ncbi:MAG: hypothetical protein SVT52_00080 [Planctomycetota bacterium]|nr:hypothetical protein [Planctomycetota bacterium]
MKTLLMVIVLAVGSLLVAGCTLMDTAEQRNRRVGQTADFQNRMLVEDWDYFWLFERNSRLTQWHPRTGY